MNRKSTNTDIMWRVLAAEIANKVLILCPHIIDYIDGMKRKKARTLHKRPRTCGFYVLCEGQAGQHPD